MFYFLIYEIFEGEFIVVLGHSGSGKSTMVGMVFARYFVYGALLPLKAEWVEVHSQTVSQTFKEEGMVTTVTERPVYTQVNGQILRLAAIEGQQMAGLEQRIAIFIF